MSSAKIKEMHVWFQQLWDQRANSNGYVTCFECGKGVHPINKECSSSYSHIIEKSNHPEYAFDPQNVVIVHPDCHNIYTMTPRKATNQYDLRNKLKRLYNI